MKQLVVLLALVSSALSLNYGLRAKFDVGLNPGTNFFYGVPQSLTEAETEGWTQLERPDGPLASLVLYCAPERVICVLIDPDSGVTSGVQVALPLSKFSGAVFDWDVQGFTDWTPTPADGEETESYKTKQVYFVTEETLKNNKNRVSSRSSSLLTEGAIWVTGFNGQLVKISSKYEDIHNSIFTKQACIPWMGRHYYYNMSSTTECKADSIFNWFPLINEGEMIGIGFLSVGKLAVADGEKLWFEQPPTSAVKAIVPSGPDCLYELADDPTITTMHIYFVDNPWWITCLFQ